MERHIIIFKEKILKVIVNATPREFDDGFFLCPVASEGKVGVGSRDDVVILFVVEDMTGKGIVESPDALHIHTYRFGRHYTRHGFLAMAQIKMNLGMLHQRGFAMLSYGKMGLFIHSEALFQCLAKQQIGECTLFSSLLMFETESLFPSPFGKRVDGISQLFWCDGIQISTNK